MDSNHRCLDVGQESSPLDHGIIPAAAAGIEPAIVSLTGSRLTIRPHRRKSQKEKVKSKSRKNSDLYLPKQSGQASLVTPGLKRHLHGGTWRHKRNGYTGSVARWPRPWTSAIRSYLRFEPAILPSTILRTSVSGLLSVTVRVAIHYVDVRALQKVRVNFGFCLAPLAQGSTLTGQRLRVRPGRRSARA
jgi:hypothetical protein